MALHGGATWLLCRKGTPSDPTHGPSSEASFGVFLPGFDTSGTWPQTRATYPALYHATVNTLCRVTRFLGGHAQAVHSNGQPDYVEAATFVGCCY